MANTRTVLISGDGIAGSTLAYWLARNRFEPTVVERARDLRSSGSPVDVRGPALAVAERMNIMPALHGSATRVRKLTFVDGHGRRVGGFNTAAFQPGTNDRGVELPRGDLAAILHRAAGDDTEYLFGDTITALDQDAGGVNVSFEHSGPRRFDMVVGADGLHSCVRRLVFGAESTLVRHLGMYVATVPLGQQADRDDEVLTYNTPGKAVSLHPGCDRALAAFMFRRPQLAGFDARDLAQHKRLLADTFSGGSWRVPEFLLHAQESDDLYFDAVSRVSLPSWSTGRIALLGDAASCVSLFGDGSSLAIAGAATLADALAADREPRTALARYETAHRALTEPKQRAMATASRLLVPTTARGIRVRNLATRLSPIVAAVQRPGRKKAPALTT